MKWPRSGTIIFFIKKANSAMTLCTTACNRHLLQHIPFSCYVLFVCFCHTKLLNSNVLIFVHFLSKYESQFKKSLWVISSKYCFHNCSLSILQVVQALLWYIHSGIVTTRPANPPSYGKIRTCFHGSQGKLTGGT